MHPSAQTALTDDLLTVVVVADAPSRATVHLDGELDLGNAEDLAAVLRDQLAGGRQVVTLDLSRLSFINSAGLRVIALAHNAFLAARGTLMLDGVDARTARLLAITHLDTAFFVTEPSETAETAPPARHLSSVAAPRR